MFDAEIQCGKCGGKRCVKAGFVKGAQRYKCKNCGRQFTQLTDRNAAKRAFALYLYAAGLSMNAIAHMLDVAPSTVLRWVRNFALRVYDKPLPGADYSGADLEEIGQILGSRKLNLGEGRRIAALPIDESAV
ncbi:MAG: helix-turn-helix domain-containing protein [Oscillospiraceae bacterium]|jgi:transposase|nr:helix-turn-helix domain-containing protein [Oscillospiraceae bacterium]